MLKPPHPVARMGYMLALWINPNNHALDAGRASSRMEKEAVAEIAGLFGWDRFLGHLTGGGTMANMEALWVSGKLAPGKKVVASAQAHYTHRRLSEVLGLPFEAVACDARARMDLNGLRKLLDGGEVGTVVATMGTTGTGSVDPLAELLALKAQCGFRLHLALFSYPSAQLQSQWQGVEFDTPEVTCLRSCLMKPEHVDWIDAVWKILDQAVDAAALVG